MSEAGHRVRQRRERLRIDKRSLAEQAGINRNTLASIENGESFGRRSLAKIDRVLDQLEREAGIDAPPAAPAESSRCDFIEFEVLGDFGPRVIVRGPAADAETLEASVIRLIQQMQTGRDMGQRPAQPLVHENGHHPT